MYEPSVIYTAITHQKETLNERDWCEQLIRKRERKRSIINWSLISKLTHFNSCNFVTLFLEKIKYCRMLNAFFLNYQKISFQLKVWTHLKWIPIDSLFKNINWKSILIGILFGKQYSYRERAFDSKDIEHLYHSCVLRTNWFSYLGVEWFICLIHNIELKNNFIRSLVRNCEKHAQFTSTRLMKCIELCILVWGKKMPWAMQLYHFQERRNIF